jgi:hypothetical protein
MHAVSIRFIMTICSLGHKRHFSKIDPLNSLGHAPPLLLVLPVVALLLYNFPSLTPIYYTLSLQVLGNNVAPKATFLGVWSSRFVAFRLWRRRNDGYRDDISTVSISRGLGRFQRWIF